MVFFSWELTVAACRGICCMVENAQPQRAMEQFFCFGQLQLQHTMAHDFFVSDVKLQHTNGT